MAEVLFRAKLVRQESTTPWGFRLQGGVEFDKPLTLLKVVQGSIAAKSGLHAGDIVVKLAGETADGMTHKNAQDAIRNAGNALEIIVERAEEEITLSPPNSPPSAVIKVKTGATPPDNQKNQQIKSSELKSAIKQQEQKNETIKKKVNTPPITNSPATQKKNVSFAEDVKQNENPSPAAAKSPKQNRKQNDVQKKKSDSKPPPVVEVVEDEAAKPSHNQDANIPTNSDQTQPPSVESSESPPPKPEPVKNTPATPPNDAHTPVKNSDVAVIQKPASDVITGKNTDSANSKPDEKKPPSEKETKKAVVNNSDSLSHQQKPKPLPLPAGELEAILKPTKPKTSETVSNGHLPQESAKSVPKPKAEKEKQGTITVSPASVSETNFSVKPDEPKSEPNDASVKVTQEVPEVPESNFVVVPGQDQPVSDRANDKDFSQTAPWRVSQRKRESSLEQPSPPIPDADPIHPWRKSKGETGGARPKDFPDTAPPISSQPGGEIPQPAQKSPVSGASVPVSDSTQPSGSLILVGRKIESPTASGEFTFTQLPPEPYSAQSPPLPPPPEYRSPQQSPQPQLSPLATHLPSATAQFIEEIFKLKPNSDYLAEIAERVNVADPELLDIPMPTVKEMVADLHRRLEDIAIQHPKIAQLITPQELGLNFQRKLLEKHAAAAGEQKEIIIDCPPNYSSTLSVDDPRKKRAFLSPSFGSSNFDVTTSPDMARRRYSLPGTYLSAQTPPHRRVHFAEPVESSVVEIEPRHRKGERRREIPPPVFSSASTLAEKLDRIERENAMASHAMNVSRSERTRLHVPRASQPSTSPPRTEQILFSSTRPRMDGVTFKPLPQGGQGFSFSIGGDGPSQIRLSFSGDKNTPVIQATQQQRASPGSAAPAGSPRQPGFSYSISTNEPQSRTFSYSPTIQEQTGGRVRIQDERNRLSPSFYQQGAESPVSRSPRTGSPLLDPYYQYRGSPTVPPQQPSYSNTLQIDTRSREQHSPQQPRTPSPVAYGYGPPQQMHSMGAPPPPSPVESPQRQRAFPPSRPVTSPVGKSPGPPQQENPTVKVSKFYTDSPARASPQRAPPRSVPSPRQQPLTSPVPPGPPARPPPGAAGSPQPGAMPGATPIPGLFALFDKKFADKFCQWQAESQERMNRQSETLKLVQEMDEEKKYWDEMY